MLEIKVKRPTFYKGIGIINIFKFIVDTVNWFLNIIPGCLRSGLSWFNWWVSFAPEFQCCYFCESSCLFILVLILISMFLR